MKMRKARGGAGRHGGRDKFFVVQGRERDFLHSPSESANKPYSMLILKDYFGDTQPAARNRRVRGCGFPLQRNGQTKSWPGQDVPARSSPGTSYRGPSVAD